MNARGDFFEARIAWDDATPYGTALSGRLARTVREVLYPRSWQKLSREMAKPAPLRERLPADELGELVRAERRESEHARIVADPAFRRPDPAHVTPASLELLTHDNAMRATVAIAPEDIAALRTWLRTGETDHALLANLGAATDAALAAAGFARTALPPDDRGPLMVGHACATWSDGEVRLWTDPFLRPKRLRYPARQQPLSPLDAPEPRQVVLLTHSHPDHFDPASLLLFPADTVVIVPRVEGESILGLDLERRCRQLGFADVRPLRWHDTAAIGRFAILALPFFGEQPLGGGAPPGVPDRNSGAVYHVAGPNGLSALFLADAGSDPGGSTLQVARDLRRAVGRVDFVFGNHRRWRLYPPQYLTSSVPHYLCYVPDDEVTIPQDIMLTAEQLSEIGAVLSARAVLPYAMGNAPWFAEAGLGTPDGHAGDAAFDPARSTDLEPRSADTLVMPQAAVHLLDPGDGIDQTGPWRAPGRDPFDWTAFGPPPRPPKLRSLALGGAFTGGEARELLELTRVELSAFMSAGPGFVELTVGGDASPDFLWSLAARLIDSPAWIAWSDHPRLHGAFAAVPDWAELFDREWREIGRIVRDTPQPLPELRTRTGALCAAIPPAALQDVARSLLGIAIPAVRPAAADRAMRWPDRTPAPAAQSLPLVERYGAAAIARALFVVKLGHGAWLLLRALQRFESPDEAAFLARLLGPAGARDADANAADIPAGELCGARLALICRAAGRASDADAATAAFAALAAAAGVEHLPAVPRWSGVTDDCSPIELSLSQTTGRTHVRFLIEAQADPASPQAYWRAGERLTAAILSRFPAIGERLRLIEDLFVPRQDDALFAIWHALEYGGDGAPLVKVYLNPSARDPARAAATVADALRRLGFTEPMPLLAELDRPGERITHIGLDLAAGARARVKIYRRHVRAEPAAFDERARTYGIAADGAFARMGAAICPDDPVLWRRPVMSCCHLSSASPGRVSGMSLYIPLTPYAPDDATAAERIERLLASRGLPQEPYARAFEALRGADPELTEGLHTYVASSCGAEPKVTAYFSPRLYQPRFGLLAADPDRFWPSPVPAEATCTI